MLPSLAEKQIDTVLNMYVENNTGSDAGLEHNQDHLRTVIILSLTVF